VRRDTINKRKAMRYGECETVKTGEKKGDDEKTDTETTRVTSRLCIVYACQFLLLAYRH